MIKNPEDQNEAKITLIDEALLENVAGGLAGGDCGPGDCTNHGGCEGEEEETEEELMR